MSLKIRRHQEDGRTRLSPMFLDGLGIDGGRIGPVRIDEAPLVAARAKVVLQRFFRDAHRHPLAIHHDGEIQSAKGRHGVGQLAHFHSKSWAPQYEPMLAMEG